MSVRAAAITAVLGLLAAGLAACSRTAAPVETRGEKKYEVKQGMDKGGAHAMLKLSVKKQESVYWYSTTVDFKVAKLTPQDPNCPQDPFYRKFPVDQPNAAREVSSGPPRPEAAANNCIYSVEFRDAAGNVIDPHIQIVQ